MSRPLVDIRLEALSTRGGKPPGLDSISVHVRYGEFFTFLGPPHSGKTDVLQAVAGFMPPSQGRILVDGQDIGGLPPGRRSVGYVFQEGALWPHMTAVQHVAFGLEQQGMSAEDIAQRVAVSNFNSDTNMELELYEKKAAARRQLESQLIRDTLSSERLEDLASQDIEAAQTEIAKATVGDWKWKQMQAVHHTT